MIKLSSYILYHTIYKYFYHVEHPLYCGRFGHVENVINAIQVYTISDIPSLHVHDVSTIFIVFVLSSNTYEPPDIV